MDDAFGLPYGDRSVACDLLGQLKCCVKGCAARSDPVDQAEFVRAGGADGFAGERDLERDFHRDLALQPDDAAGGREQSAFDFG
ncbi:hypothetical protein N602_31585 [Mycobacterium avium subsp. hominissuis 10-5606]|nr:hypothetical protein N602_31585 [Mycobacterium avium subsp. hominissuis 10-5606]